MPKACVAIVDPYSSGQTLAEGLAARDAPCVAVVSSDGLSAELKAKFDPRAFVAVIQHRGDLRQTVKAVGSLRPTHVVAGFESGVELADRLACELELPCNDPLRSQARRDKYLMAECVRSRGLRTPRQVRSSDASEMVAWTDDGVGWPVIVKPLNSVASDQVVLCAGADELRAAVEKMLATPNVLGLRNEAALVQEFVAGTEYAVDIVSLAGRRKTTAIWEYGRPEGAADFVCYDTMTLLPYAGVRQGALQSFAFAVLDALGIQHGPAHCELIWGREEQPVLVEVGARLSAGVNATLSRLCGGICQLDESIDAILDPDRFLATLGQTPRLQQSAMNVFLLPRERGRLVRTRGLDQIRQLPTLHSMSAVSTPGETVGRVAGRVTLVAPDHRAIRRDVRLIRSLERRGIFEVEP